MGERPPHLIIAKLGLWRSFFSSGRMTAPIEFGEVFIRRSFFWIGRTTAPIDAGEVLIRRSFFWSRRTTAPIDFVRFSAGRSIGSFGANDRRSLCFFLLCWRSWAVDRLVLGERPATALMNSNFCCFWAVDRPNLGERPALVLLVGFILASKSLVFVLLHLDFRASYQLICTLKKLVKNT